MSGLWAVSQSVWWVLGVGVWGEGTFPALLECMLPMRRYEHMKNWLRLVCLSCGWSPSLCGGFWEWVCVGRGHFLHC